MNGSISELKKLLSNPIYFCDSFSKSCSIIEFSAANWTVLLTIVESFLHAYWMKNMITRCFKNRLISFEFGQTDNTLLRKILFAWGSRFQRSSFMYLPFDYFPVLLSIYELNVSPVHIFDISFGYLICQQSLVCCIAVRIPLLVFRSL